MSYFNMTHSVLREIDEYICLYRVCNIHPNLRVLQYKTSNRQSCPEYNYVRKLERCRSMIVLRTSSLKIA